MKKLCALTLYFASKGDVPNGYVTFNVNRAVLNGFNGDNPTTKQDLARATTAFKNGLKQGDEFDVELNGRHYAAKVNRRNLSTMAFRCSDAKILAAIKKNGRYSIAASVYGKKKLQASGQLELPLGAAATQAYLITCDGTLKISRTTTVSGVSGVMASGKDVRIYGIDIEAHVIRTIVGAD